MALSWTLDKLGPICRTADDCGLVMQSIAGHDPLDETSVTRPYRYPEEPPPARPFKLALLREPFRKLQPEVQANFDASLKVLEGFAALRAIGCRTNPRTNKASRTRRIYIDLTSAVK